MNFRSKTTAMVLCFFLGFLGAHWFYLGRENWGWMYAAVALGAWPFALSFAALPLLGAFFMTLAFVLHGLLWIVIVYDFFSLLAMHPRRFDIEFNH